MTLVIVFDVHSLDQTLQQTQPVLVDIWGDDCIKCERLAPVIDEIAAEQGGRLVVGKYKASGPDDPIAARYQIRGIPTLLLFRNGEVILRMSDYQPKATILEALKPYLN